MDGKTEQISRMILDYLRRNPDAGDTLEGIVEWWMNVQRIEYSAKEVAETLENLVRKGLIRMYKVGEGAAFYKINHDFF